jgi:hypothetical protein
MHHLQLHQFGILAKPPPLACARSPHEMRLLNRPERSRLAFSAWARNGKLALCKRPLHCICCTVVSHPVHLRSSGQQQSAGACWLGHPRSHAAPVLHDCCWWHTAASWYCVGFASVTTCFFCSMCKAWRCISNCSHRSTTHCAVAVTTASVSPHQRHSISLSRA